MSESNGSTKKSVDERIGDVERRLEFRRGRIEHHVHEIEQRAREIKERLTRKSTWMPIGAVAGALAIGFAVARARASDQSVHRSSLPPLERRAGLAATVLGLAGGATRLALSPQGRALWHAFKRGRDGR